MTKTLEKLVDSLVELPQTLRERFLVWNDLDEDRKDRLSENVEWLLSTVREKLACSGDDPQVQQSLLPRALRAAVELAQMNSEMKEKLGFRMEQIVPKGPIDLISVTSTAIGTSVVEVPTHDPHCLMAA